MWGEQREGKKDSLPSAWVEFLDNVKFFSLENKGALHNDQRRVISADSRYSNCRRETK